MGFVARRSALAGAFGGASRTSWQRRPAEYVSAAVCHSGLHAGIAARVLRTQRRSGADGPLTIEYRLRPLLETEARGALGGEERTINVHLRQADGGAVDDAEKRITRHMHRNIGIRGQSAIHTVQ